VTRRGEFDLIADLFVPLAEGNPGALGLLDDAALVEVPQGFEIVTTVDAMVEGVHFTGQEAADLVGQKLLRVNLSDLAAMGATPLCYLLTLVRPPEISESWLQRFVSGLARDQRTYDIHLAGGDTVSTAGPLVLSLTAIGSVEKGKALKRKGAAVGDIVYVSGTIGDAALGLALVQDSEKFGFSGLERDQRNFLAARLQSPEPRLDLGRALVDVASAAVDISDGLVADLGHLAAASDVGVTLDLDALPVSAAANSIIGDDETATLGLMTGGEDYELAFTMSPHRTGETNELIKQAGLPLTAIGRIVAGNSVAVLGKSGEELDVPAAGYTHF
jgi:thiamine-monophosphate kinase